MKKLNRKGFTLIELLAVIVILGILMLTAIPAVSRAITKSRKNTFWQNAKQYIQAAQTPFLSGEYVKVDSEGHNTTEVCGTPAVNHGYYLYLDALELEGGSISKSSFGASYTNSGNCKPRVVVVNAGKDATGDNEGIDRLEWYFIGTDQSHNGIDSFTKEGELGLASVKVATATTCAAGITIPGTSNNYDLAQCNKQS